MTIPMRFGPLFVFLTVALAITPFADSRFALANPAEVAIESEGALAADSASDATLAQEPETVIDIGGDVRRSSSAGPQNNAGAEIPACASDADVLGLSRVVEIDATDGPEFGGQKGQRLDFLQDREVVLTFDDGPMRAYTRRVLAALERHCTRATFFMVGRMAAADPPMVREVAAGGHTVASHTWSHKNLGAVGAARAEQDFEMGISAVNRAAGGASAPFFRFPYLGESRRILDLAAARGIATFWIDVDSKDYLTRSPQLVKNRIMAQLKARGKGVILMHDIQPSTVGAIGPLLDDLHRHGFKVVHIVPQARAATVAAYDDAVAKAFGDKSRALRDNPLADRSVVWSAEPGAAVSVKRGGAARRTEKQTTAAPAGEWLPWLQPDTPAKSQKTERKRKAPDSSDLQWHLQPFGF
jgi:peptidoglycan/xylan/chitin deacetylase (PgdA/CDA1 family)